MPMVAPRMPIGTVSMMTNGLTKLSNCAARTRYAISRDTMNTKMTAPLDSFSFCDMPL